MPKDLPEKVSPIKDQTPPRQAGESLQKQIDEYIDEKVVDWLIPPALLLVSALVFWWAYFFKVSLWSAAWLFTAVFLVSIPLSAYKIIKGKRYVENLKQGRDGERIVGHLLEDLRKHGYQIFHDIPNAKNVTFNIDHAIIGPAGVFTIETKTYSKLTIGDKKIRYENNQLTIPGLSREIAEDALNQAQASADFLRQKLTESTGHKIKVQPILIFPGWWVEEPATDRDTLPVWVINQKRVFDYIIKSPDQLTRENLYLYAQRLQMHLKDCI